MKIQYHQYHHHHDLMTYPSPEHHEKHQRSRAAGLSERLRKTGGS